MSNAANVPDIGAPFLDPSGRISPVWWLFLISLFNRTGSETGTTPSSGDGQDALSELGAAVPPQSSDMLRRLADLEASVEGFIPIPPIGGTVIVLG